MGTNLDLGGRSAIVVGGAGGGIGTAMVSTLARAGANIGAITNVAEHGEDTKALVESLGQRCEIDIVDVQDEAALRASMQQLCASVGPVQHLVNVVGGALPPDWYRAEDCTMEAFDHMMGRNVRYAFVAMQEVAKHIIASGGEGSIVSVSSVAANAVPLLGPYGAAKAALESLTRTTALEWGPKGIRVNAVAAGTIKTPRAGTSDLDEHSSSIPTGRRGTPDDIANAALFMLSPLADHITGQTLTVDGGASVGTAHNGKPPVFVTNPDVLRRFA